MSDVKSKFTLHTEYKGYGPGHYHSEMLARLASSCEPNTLGCVLCSVLGVMCLLIGLFAAPLTVYFIYIDYNLAHKSQPVTAIVTSCAQDPRAKDDKAYLQYDYHYTYSVAGVVYNELVPMNEPCAAYPIGTALDAIYLPSDPSISRIVQSGMTPAHPPLESTIMFGLVTVISVFMVRAMRQYLLRYRYIQRHGEPPPPNIILLEGEITEISGHGPSDFMVRVRYKFETPSKYILKDYAWGKRPDLQDKELPPVGTPVAVMYNADNGKHMVL